MDTLADFIEERCVLDPQAWALAGKLYEIYKEWIEAAGERPLSQKALGTRLTERGFKATRYGPKQARTWSGFRLRTDDDPPPQTDRGSTDGSDTDSPFANGVEKSHVENLKNVSDVSDVSEDAAVCETDGCMNGVAGSGLHCDGCLNADVEAEVPW
jgi:phage/plasmid-associated DNA primase